MIEDDALTVLQRLDTALALIGDYWQTLSEGDERRYTESTAALLRRERAKLAIAIQRNDAAHVLWALRSIADMRKGLIDIGSAWCDARPDAWEYAMETANLAHRMERADRRAVGL